MKLAILFALALPAWSAAITSTFDNNSQGWFVAGDGPDTSVTYIANGGHPGGAIERVDLTDGYMHFQAPAAFLGNLSAFYNGSLSYDLLQTVPDTDTVWFYRELLKGSNGLLILHTIGLPPDTADWRHLSVQLNPSAGWIIVSTIEDFTGTPVTDAQFQSVLANVSALYITGDLISHSDFAILDNVALQAIPEPSGFFPIAAILLAASAVRRRAHRCTRHGAAISKQNESPR